MISGLSETTAGMWKWPEGNPPVYWDQCLPELTLLLFLLTPSLIFGHVKGRDACYWQLCRRICPAHGSAIPPAARGVQEKDFWWGKGSHDRFMVHGSASSIGKVSAGGREGWGGLPCN